MFGFRKRECANPAPGTASTDGPFEVPPELTPDREVGFIVRALEEKIGTPFKMRIKLDGYFDEPEYRLVVTNYGFNLPYGVLMSVYGGEAVDVLDVKEKFVEAYWKECERFSNVDRQKLDDFEIRRYENWKKSSVAGSREEFVLGLIGKGVL